MITLEVQLLDVPLVISFVLFIIVYECTYLLVAKCGDIFIKHISYHHI